MLDACLPLGPVTTSNETFCPSLRVLKPFIWIAEKWANKSSPPSSGVMSEQVLATFVRRDEAVALSIVEPFDRTRCHSCSFRWLPRPHGCRAVHCGGRVTTSPTAGYSPANVPALVLMLTAGGELFEQTKACVKHWDAGCGARASCSAAIVAATSARALRAGVGCRPVANRPRWRGRSGALGQASFLLADRRGRHRMPRAIGQTCGGPAREIGAPD